jgi:hypothetical protein
MFTSRIIGSLLLLLLSTYVAAQAPKLTAPTPAPDYANPDFWAALPDKKDLSDELPKGLGAQLNSNPQADVFFVHPTTYTSKKKDDMPWNANLADKKLNQRTDESTIKFQASIFNGVGKVYAPRYRQAHIMAYFTRDQELAKEVFEVAYADVKAAFEYYLEHYNQGRPIIIASHSQGTTHCKRLLKEFFDGKPLQKQLVAAYLVGIPVEKGYFQNIPACDSANATQCVCSWRTYQTGNFPPYFRKEEQVVVTNPLSWKTDTLTAPRELNKGAVLLKFDKVLPAVCDAKIEKGYLWVSKPKFPGSFLYNNPNYHIADYNLFYLNVRENVGLRLTTYLANGNK